jgi:hypothetical protein
MSEAMQQTRSLAALQPNWWQQPFADIIGIAAACNADTKFHQRPIALFGVRAAIQATASWPADRLAFAHSLAVVRQEGPLQWKRAHQWHQDQY